MLWNAPIFIEGWLEYGHLSCKYRNFFNFGLFFATNFRESHTISSGKAVHSISYQKKTSRRRNPFPAPLGLKEFKISLSSLSLEKCYLGLVHTTKLQCSELKSLQIRCYYTFNMYFVSYDEAMPKKNSNFIHELSNNADVK